MRKYFLKLIAFIFLIPCVYNAQGISLGPQIGYYKTEGADEGSFMYGGAVRLKLSSGFGLEGSINYRQEEFNNGTVTVKSYPVMASLMLYPLPIVYGVAGGGWYNVTVDYSGNLGSFEDETTSEFGWHAGAGAELPLGNAALLSGDIRYVFLQYQFDSLKQSVDLSSDFFVITVGLYFKL
ncbi:MAG: outer membrane beta-barrel protein [bacterium]